MPIRNEAVHIQSSLDALLSQDYPNQRIEVLIVDGMSDDETPEIVKEIIHNNPNFNIRCLINPERIFSTGFNKGLENSHGEIIIMLGGHTEICSNYIHQCIIFLEETGGDCVGGYINTIAETKTSQSIALAMSSTFGVGGVAFRTRNNETKEVDTVAFGAYPRSVFQHCGMLDEEMIRNQDDEFNYRLRSMGGKIHLNPAISSNYYSRSTLFTLWKQYYQYGFWKVRVLQKHPRQIRPRQLIPPIFVTTFIGLVLLSMFSSIGLIMLITLLGIYLLATIIASIWVAKQNGIRHILKLPVIYAILHTSYGLGFLVGFVRFFNRWGDKTGRVPKFQGADV